MLDATDLSARAVLAHIGWAAAVADSMSTYVGVRWLGTAEGTPAVAAAIDMLGLGPGLILRTLVAMSLVAVVWVVPRRTPGPQTVGLAAIATANVWVVVANLRLMWMVMP